MKILPIVLLVASAAVYAQNVNFDQSDKSILIRNGAFSDSGKDPKILGTPFLTESYIDAEIVNVKISVKAKYNAFKDEIEVLKEDKGFIISKIPEYKTVRFIQSNEFLEFVSYYDEKGDQKQGYLFQIFKKGNLTLYRQEKIILEPGRAATSSYDSDVPSRYKIQTPKYFITNDNGKIVQFPTNKKKVLEMFPSKKVQIEEYIKLKKPNFSKIDAIISFFENI
ncbi:hypothetical protein [Chryseobacterium chendengshani]|uniref:hypothetical protein n=1 Tax=Chryseobacterium sp. LJ756 TaxID=2864113 RepID=UPI001C63BC99|nr:hypothetical protein [Chryseobacterium sp. LJ756]MBW7675634.1 hypothetical protein [Chryseobacterium sp. LJ756]